MPFDGITWPDVHVLAGVGGNADPGTAYLHLGVGPGLGTGLLGGTTYVDITADVNSATIKRGRDSDIDSATPGSCVLVVDNSSGIYDPTNLATPFWGPNLLTTQQESLEDGTTTGWQAGQDTTIANTAAQAYHGTKALQLTKTVGTGTLFAQDGTAVVGTPFPPSAPCRASAWFRTAATARQCKVRVAFHTMSGTYLSGQDLLSNAVTDATTGWVQALVVGRSPAQSTRVIIELSVASGVNTEFHVADQAAWPTSLRALDTGYTTLGPTILGDFALNLMRKVEQTEFGLLFCDGSNTLTFYDRHRSATATRSVNVQAAFTDTQGASEIEMASLDVAKNRDRLINDVHIT